MAGLRYSRLSFGDLKGWGDDDHQAALDVYARSHSRLPPDWPAPPDGNARQYFEAAFAPVLIEDDIPMLFTGYFEPEIAASPVQTETHRFPALAVPPDFDPTRPYLTRREIEESNALAGQGLELAWFADPLDLFFLQVQGSGRLRFPDGSLIRLGFAAKNGRPYTSVGKVLVERGAATLDQVSPDLIREWVANQGAEGRALLWQNQSYVFSGGWTTCL